MLKKYIIILIFGFFILGFVLGATFSNYAGISMSPKYDSKQLIKPEKYLPLKDGQIKIKNSNLPLITEETITICGVITRGGNYSLETDIYCNHTGICMPIVTNELVTIDCRGHSFISLAGPDSGAQDIESFGNGSIIVKNCHFINWFQPLSLRNNDSQAINNTFYNNYYGIIVGDWNVPRLNRGIKIADNALYGTSQNEIVFQNVIEASLSNNRMCKKPTGSEYYGPYNIYCDNFFAPGITGNSVFYKSSCQLIRSLQACPKNTPMPF